MKSIQKDLTVNKSIDDFIEKGKGKTECVLPKLIFENHNRGGETFSSKIMGPAQKWHSVLNKSMEYCSGSN